MRPLFVVPAVLMPLALVALIAAVRRIGEAAHDLHRELAQTSTAREQLTALRDEADGLRLRAKPRRRSVGPRASH